jgi:hypothetical protein
LNVRKRVLVMKSGVVEAAVIAARTPGTIRLGNHVQRRGPRRVRTPYYTGAFHFSKLCPVSGQLARIQSAGLGVQRPPLRFIDVSDIMARGTRGQVLTHYTRELIESGTDDWRKVKELG